MTANRSTRRAAVSGLFYPADPLQLRRLVSGLLDGVVLRPGVPPPKALIVPHAGYTYSGAVAASGYAQLRPIAASIRRVAVLGPAHRVAVRGLALPDIDLQEPSGAFDTPLGTIPLDGPACRDLLELPQVVASGRAHQSEHSIEVQLPFLQVLLPEFTLVPLVVGQATTDEVLGVLETVWGGPETLLVISTDLSHYHDRRTANRLDGETSQLIEDCRDEGLSGERACGHVALRGLLRMSRALGLKVTTLDRRSSGDVSKASDSVVGYGAYLVG
jgi:hypothetical protein